MSLFALLIITMIIIIAVASVLYWLYYQHRINKQLRGETSRARRLLSPLVFTVITAFVVLIIYFGVAFALASRYSVTMQSPQEYFNAIYDFKVYDSSEMTDYRSVYSMDENPGYSKTLIKQGNIQFTCFIR